MKKEQWYITNKKADFDGIAKEFGILPVTARLLRNREVLEKEEIRAFLSGGKRDFHAPFLLDQMNLAVRILKEKIQLGKKIRVVLDYDVDGCMSGYILLRLFSFLGGDVDFDIPDRRMDGYGMNVRIVEAAKEAGVDTIITCDNGIAAVEAVEAAKALGLTVIVTDHHDVPFAEEAGQRRYLLPPADCVVNPKTPGNAYPFKSLCGAGVAYKLAEAMTADLSGRDALLTELLQFVCVATICDIVDLQGENRLLVKEGFAVLRETANPGFLALMEACGISPAELSYYHIGFILGPCINASGRLLTAKKALSLFMAKSQTEAMKTARELKELNEERKTLTEKGFREAVRQIAESGTQKEKVFVIYLPDCHESVCGIIAGRIREKYNHPVFVLTDAEEEGYVKGSGRSVSGYHMFEGLLEVQELLSRFGGHPMAAGLTLLKKNLALFSDRLNAGCTLEDADFVFRVLVDAPLPFSEASCRLVHELERMEPFGKANPKPVFALKGVHIMKVAVLGKNQNVLRLTMQDEDGICLEGVYFGDIPEFLQAVETWYQKEGAERLFVGRQSPVFLDLVYEPTLNRFRGKEKIQLQIHSYRQP